MINKLIERVLVPFIKNEEDRLRLSTVIIPTFIVRSGYFIISALIAIVLTRTLGPSRYGVFSLTGTIIFSLMNFSSYGFEVIALKYTSSYLSRGETGLWKGLYNWSSKLLIIIATAVALGSMLFIWVFVFALHIIPKTEYTLPVLVTCSIIPIYALMNFYANLLRGQGKSLLSFLPDNIVKPVFFLTVLVVLKIVLKHLSLHIAIGLNIVSFGVAFIFIFLLFRKVNNMKGIVARYDKPEWRRFVISLFILTLVSSLSNKLDSILLGALKDSAQVGIYSAAEKYASFLLFFMYVMNMIIAPSLASLNTPEGKDNLQRMITRTIRWVMLFTLPVFVVVIIFSRQIMHLSGEGFEPGKTALVIICCGLLIDIAFGPVGNFALMTGNEKYNTIYMSIGILLNIVLNLILTPRMGFIGTAIASASCTVFWNAAMFFTIKKRTGIRTWIFG